MPPYTITSINLNDPVVYEIVAARVQLLFLQPFFGSLSTRFGAPIDASAWCRSAATDGRHFFYNREFIKKLSKPQLIFLLCHEILHVVFDHLGRRGNRDPKIWNMANDFIVNDALVRMDVGTMPEGGLLDPRFTELMTSEEVYDLLIKNSVKIQLTLDDHLEDSEGGDKDEDGNGKGSGQEVEVRILGKDGPPKITEADRQKIRNEIRTALIQTVQQVGAGKTPAGILRMIDHLINPKLDWRAMLDAHIRSALKDDYTFQRISRHSWHTGAILPGQNYRDTIDIAVAVDSSGSMSEEMLRDIISETMGIMTTFQDFRLKLWTFDTEVYGYQEFTGDNINDIYDYNPQGGGGTMFECNWEFMKQQGIEPQRLIIFTDGYPNGSWGEPNYVDTLFVIHGDPSHRITAPFGATAWYEDKDNR